MLQALAHAVDALVAIDVSEACDSEIRETVIAVRREIDRQDALVAHLLAAVHQRGLAAGDGASSTAAWMRTQTGQRVHEAQASLQAGLACATLPLTAKAWIQGEISSSAARTIGRGRRRGHEDEYAGTEATMVGYAAARDFGGLDSMIRHYQNRCDALDDKAPADKNGVFHSRVANRWALKGDLDNLAGLTIDAAIRAATDKPTCGDDRSPAKRRSDALTRVCRFFLDHGNSPTEAGEVPHISIVLTDTTVRDHTPTQPGETALTAAEIDQLLCEANLSRIVLGADGIPLDVGRATRTPSRALRRAIDLRDRHCRFPNCDRRPSWCQAHHVIEWTRDGPTKLSNLVLLCSFHHHLIHKPGWHATFDGHTLTATNPDGTTVGTTTT